MEVHWVNYITAIGAVISTLSAIGGVAYTWWKRSPFKVWFRGHADLLHDLASMQARAEDAEKGKRYAEQLNATLEPLTAEHRRQIEELKEQTSMLAVLRVKCDVFKDWSSRLVDHIMHLNSRIAAAGLPTDGIDMPPVPHELADKFGIPETLR